MSSGLMISGLLLTSIPAAAGTWYPILSAYDDFRGNPYYGPELAVGEVMYLAEGALRPEEMLLIAITNGEDDVLLYSFDTSTETLSYEETITIDPPDPDLPIAYTPSFLTLDAVGEGDEWCLVVPSLCDASDTDQGSISIIRLTERDVSGDLEVLEDCFSSTGYPHWSVYFVTDLPSGLGEDYDYAVSTETGAIPPPDDDLKNVVILASYDSSNERFEEEAELEFPDTFYADDFAAVWGRTWITGYQDFSFAGNDETLRHTTNHNGGVIFWDPADNGEIVSRIAASQHGGWYYDSNNMGELGDLHRVAVLEGASQTFPNINDTYPIEGRLLFSSNFTMGFMIHDISKPEAPQFVWQWDGDTRPHESGPMEEDWDWQGAGDIDDDTFDQATADTNPSEAFGIGVAWNDGRPTSAPTIHVYLACGVDGLRRFDLSEFIDPFGYEDSGASTNLCYDDLEVDLWDEFEPEPDVYLEAYDLRTFCEEGDTYIFTSWRQSRIDSGGQLWV